MARDVSLLQVLSLMRQEADALRAAEAAAWADGDAVRAAHLAAMAEGTDEAVRRLTAPAVGLSDTALARPVGHPDAPCR
jgi:hypothetical protein